jgi:hypothetical protein
VFLEVERGSTRSHSVENLLWKRLWTCRKRLQDYDDVIDNCLDVIIEVERVFWAVWTECLNSLRWIQFWQCPCHGWGGLVTVLSSRKYRFGPGSVHVWFAVDEVIMGHAFVWVLRFFHATVIPPMPSTEYSCCFCSYQKDMRVKPVCLPISSVFFFSKMEEHWMDKQFHSFAFKRWMWCIVDIWKPACNELQWKTPKCTADTKSDRLCEWNWQAYVFVYMPGPTSCFKRTVPKATSFIFNSYPAFHSWMTRNGSTSVHGRNVPLVFDFSGIEGGYCLLGCHVV